MYIIHINYVYIRKTTYNAVYTDATYTDDTQTHNLRYQIISQTKTWSHKTYFSFHCMAESMYVAIMELQAKFPHVNTNLKKKVLKLIK